MKKILICLGMFILLFTLTGCTSNVKLDLDTVKEELVNLTNDKFSPNVVYEIDTASYLGESEDLYDLDTFDIGYTDAEYFYGAKSINDNYFYLIIKPTEEALDTVKDKMDTYMSSLEEDMTVVDEHEGYLVYIYSSDSDKFFEEIKNVKEKIFPSLMEVEKTNIQDALQIEEEWVEEFLMMQPMMMVNASQLIIVKPTSGHKDDVKEKINEYLENLEDQWETYLPAQYDLVVNRKEETLGGYLVYIISEDNDLVYNTIKKCEAK